MRNDRARQFGSWRRSSEVDYENYFVFLREDQMK